MKTGSLRARLTLTTISLLAIVVAIVVTAVTLAYRAKLDGDLHNRLSAAGAVLERAGNAAAAKPRLLGLALEGIIPSFGASPTPVPAQRHATIRAHGSLLILTEVLPDGTQVTLAASRAGIDHDLTNLLIVELVVAATALLLAIVLVSRGTRAALQPLTAVIQTATRIAGGDTKLRLNPSRVDTELGSLAAAFDQMLDALEAAINEARASDAATRRFLTDASHELRSPIAALQASIETLLREQPERPDRDRLEATAARDCERLGGLVNDLLGLARLEAHPIRTPTNLATITRQLLREAQTRAPQATITLSANGDATVSGDPDALERVLRNLIDNALAAITATGTINMRLQRHNGHIDAHVTDDGPGVPEQERERIFERFVRLDASKPGHGLGLAIARRIAHQHNGDLTCHPAHTGATFTLSLPTENPLRQHSALANSRSANDATNAKAHDDHA